MLQNELRALSLLQDRTHSSWPVWGEPVGAMSTVRGVHKGQKGSHCLELSEQHHFPQISRTLWGLPPFLQPAASLSIYSHPLPGGDA